MSASVCMKFSNFYSLFFFSAENCVVAVFYHCEKGIKTLSAIGFNVSPLTPQPLAPLLPGTVIRPQLVCMQASPKKYSMAMHTLQGNIECTGIWLHTFWRFCCIHTCEATERWLYERRNSSHIMKFFYMFVSSIAKNKTKNMMSV